MARWGAASVTGIWCVLILLVSCGSSETSSDPSRAAESVPVATAAPTEPPEPTAEPIPVPTTAPAIEPGGLAVGVVEIDGVPVDYVTVVPAGFEIGDEAPLVLALPPGGQDLELTRGVADNSYRAEAVARGWVVISPAATDDERFYRGGERLLPTLLDWVETWMTPEGGLPHVSGISNGGLSAFRYAAEHPDRVASIVAWPGFPRRGDADEAVLSTLTDVPIRLFAGETDTAWVEPMDEAAARLTELGGDVEYEVLAGEGHVPASLRDGKVIFDTLDELRVASG